MTNSLIVAMPLFGAALPILVTQFSKDDDLKAVGRAVVKYAIAMPLALVIIVVGGLELMA